MSGFVSTRQLKADLETLETFKKRVDLLLADLEESAAAPKEVREGTLKASHLGTGFAEAEALYSAYNSVHDRLKELSRTAADQIEAMSLLVHIANNDYQNVDEDEAVRLWRIRAAAERHYREHTAESEEPGGTDTTSERPKPKASEGF